MNDYRKAVAVIVCLGVMMGAAGCANKDVVKKDEAIGKEAVTKPDIAASTASKALPDQKKEEPKTLAVPAKDTQANSSPQQASNTATIQAAFDKIYFDFDSSDLSKSARDTLTRSAEILMKSQKEAKLRIEGNCDELGSAEYNLALGERRAKAAAKYLIALGVKPERLSVMSFGKEKPTVLGADEVARSKNRRDEFIIHK